MIQKTNNIAPNLTNKYLFNSKQITDNSIDFIESALPGIPESSKWGARGFLANYIYEKYLENATNKNEDEK